MESMGWVPRGRVGAQRCAVCCSGAGLGSGGEIGHQFYDELGAGKLDGVNFQSAPADEAQGAGYGFWRLDAARAAPEQTQAGGQDADAENENGEMHLRKRVF